VRLLLQILQQNFHRAAGTRKNYVLHRLRIQFLREAHCLQQGAFAQAEGFIHHGRIVDKEMPLAARRTVLIQ